MQYPEKEEIKAIIFAKLLTLTQGPDPKIAIAAARELGELAGLYADVAPKAITAQQTNNFTLSPEAMGGILEGLKAITRKPDYVSQEIEIQDAQHY